MADDTDVLRELLRQAERVLDHQARRMEEQDDKTEQTLALGIGVLGGGLALATWMNLAASSDLPFAILIGVGALSNLLALRTLLDAYLSMPLALLIGPHPRWLAERLRDAGASTVDVLLDLVEASPTYYEQNANALIRATRERRRGLRMLLAAVAFYVVSAAYILVKAG